MVETILHDSIPCWYELSFDPKDSAIIMRIHKDVIENFPGSIDKFVAKSSDLARGITLNTNNKEDFIELKVSISAIGIEENETATIKLFNDISNLSSSLEYLFSILNYKVKTSSSAHQLMNIWTQADAISGLAICAYISKDLREWLSNFSPTHEIKEVTEAMRNVSKRVCGADYKLFFPDDFKAWTSDTGLIVLECPGMSCGIGGAHYRYSNEDCGYEITSTNLDSHIQMITLLAGLASLHDMARRRMSAQK